MTLKKIAELSGVSVSTVSKVMHGSGEMSDATIIKVKNAAKELGCLEKYYTGKYEKKVITVILPEICSEFYSNIAAEYVTPYFLLLPQTKHFFYVLVSAQWLSSVNVACHALNFFHTLETKKQNTAPNADVTHHKSAILSHSSDFVSAAIPYVETALPIYVPLFRMPDINETFP